MWARHGLSDGPRQKKSDKQSLVEDQRIVMPFGGLRESQEHQEPAKKRDGMVRSATREGSTQDWPRGDFVGTSMNVCAPRCASFVASVNVSH